jgi:hypothetical protein
VRGEDAGGGGGHWDRWIGGFGRLGLGGCNLANINRESTRSRYGWGGS